MNPLNENWCYASDTVSERLMRLIYNSKRINFYVNFAEELNILKVHEIISVQNKLLFDCSWTSPIDIFILYSITSIKTELENLPSFMKIQEYHLNPLWNVVFLN